MYIILMDIEFDPTKDATNLAKHGISLARAADLEWSEAMILPDDRYDYGEDRFYAVAPLDGRVHVLIFTSRNGVVRAISLRKANAKEVRRYDER